MFSLKLNSSPLLQFFQSNWLLFSFPCHLFTNKLNLNDKYDNTEISDSSTRSLLKQQKNNQICTYLSFNLRFLLFDEIGINFKFLETKWYCRQSFFTLWRVLKFGWSTLVSCSLIKSLFLAWSEHKGQKGGIFPVLCLSRQVKDKLGTMSGRMSWNTPVPRSW